MRRFEGKVAVITGGGTGIGRATALAMARDGADVVVVSNVARQVKSVADEIRSLGQRSMAREVDVTDMSGLNRLADEVDTGFGQADILVTCAGVMGARKLFTEINAAEWRQTMAVNLDGTFNAIKVFLPGMITRNSGRIITLSSASGKQPAALNSDYAASKHAVIGLTKTIAIELGLLQKNGVTANTLCPGPVETPMMDAIAEHLAPKLNIAPEDFRKTAVTKNIQQRMLDPEEVANMAAYLASNEARGVTGQAINVCGGIVLF